MRAIRVLGILAIFTATVTSARADDSTSPEPRPAAAGRLKPHDSAHSVMHLARSDAFETAGPGVIRAEKVRRTVLAEVQAGASCDSILCPRYVMLGVGF